MSYRIIMVYALTPTTGIIYSAEQRIMYEPKRTDIVAKAYNNCIIPISYGYHLTCL